MKQVPEVQDSCSQTDAATQAGLVTPSGNLMLAQICWSGHGASPLPQSFPKSTDIPGDKAMAPKVP